MSSTLSAHSPKFGSKLTTFEQLADIPVPVALGPHHKPVPHIVLVDAIREEVATRGYDITREQLAVSRTGAALFGVMDLVPADGSAMASVDRGLSFGFRNATDATMAIRGVAGARVFVCDNLALSGDTFAMSRKNTTRLDLRWAIANGFDKFLRQSGDLETKIARLQSVELTNDAAKVVIFDVFAAGLAPVRLFDDVERFYFRPDPGATDCQPRTLWGVMNAFTRAYRDLSPTRLFNASVALGRRLLNGVIDVKADKVE